MKYYVYSGYPPIPLPIRVVKGWADVSAAYIKASEGRQAFDRMQERRLRHQHRNGTVRYRMLPRAGLARPRPTLPRQFAGGVA